MPSAHVTVQEIDDLIADLLGGSPSLLDGMGGAALEVIREQALLGGAQGGVDGGELLEDVGAVSFVLDHAGEAFDLTADAGEALEEIATGVGRDAQGVIGGVVLEGGHVRWLLFYTRV